MTITQLEYIVAVDTYRSFVLAAEKCFVTQPTLSMQVQKLEEELDVRLFDRSKLPVQPTPVGIPILRQARAVLKECALISETVAAFRNQIKGTLRLGIIPTLAPYLLPSLVARFTKHYPDMRLEIWEYPTEMIRQQLRQEELDCGILATPLNDAHLDELPVFYESFVVYTSPTHPLAQKKVLKLSDLTPSDVWLLNEGHCMRNQVLNLCAHKDRQKAIKNLEYNTGSVETLKHMVELNSGWTILPELSVRDLKEDQLDMVRYFKSPEPVREISLVTHRNFIRKTQLDALKREIQDMLPENMLVRSRKKIIDIDIHGR